MSSLSTTCPHCRTENAAFTSIALQSLRTRAGRHNVYYACNNCEGGLIAIVSSRDGSDPHAYRNGLTYNDHYQIIELIPTIKSIDIPEHLPKNIASFHRQALNAYQRRDWDASGTMCRKTVDVATRLLGGDCNKFHDRINQIAAKNLITPALKDWAHTIRYEGNDANHDIEEYTEERCSELLNFTHMFLLYAFTMPKMMELRKESQVKPG